MERSRLIAIAAMLAALGVTGLVGIGVMALARGGSGGETAYSENAFGAGLPEPAGGLYIIKEMYGGGPSMGEAARRADLIARAAVVRKLEPFWSTPDSARPRISDQELMTTPGYNIYTPYELRIKSVLKGEAEGGETITLNRIGGRIGNDIVALSHDPFSFTEGTEVVLFLRDCGQKRADWFDDPSERFRIIDRYRLDKNGEPVDPNIAYREIVETVEREGTLKAKRGEVPC